MADLNEKASLGPDLLETSRATEALMALTKEILSLRTTMRSQEKDIEKMNAAEVAARQEQISKLEALTEAQKVAIKLAEDEALTLGASGKATEELLEKVIKQTRLAEKSQQLVEKELTSREALSKRIEEATKQEQERAKTGLEIQQQKLSAVPSVEATVLKKIADQVKIESAVTTAAEQLKPDVVPTATTPAANTQPATETKTEKYEFVGKDAPFQKAIASLSAQITKLIPSLSTFTGRIGKANQDYDKFLSIVQNGYSKFKELLTVTGFLNFLFRIVAVSLIFLGQGMKDLVVKGFNKIKEIDFKRVVDKIAVDFNTAGKRITEFSKNLSDKSEQISRSLVLFGEKLAKDPIGTVKETFMKSMKGLDAGFDKVAQTVNKFRDKIFETAGNYAKAIFNSSSNFIKGIGTSISSFAGKVGSFLGPLSTGVSRFVISLGTAAMSIVTSIGSVVFGLMGSVIAFSVGVGSTIFGFAASVVTATIGFVAPVVAAALGFVGSILVAVGTFIAGIAAGVVSFIAALIAPISPFILIAGAIVLVLGLMVFAGYKIYKNFETIVSALQQFGQKIMEIRNGVEQFFFSIYDTIGTAIDDLFGVKIWESIKKSAIGKWLFGSSMEEKQTKKIEQTVVAETKKPRELNARQEDALTKKPRELNARQEDALERKKEFNQLILKEKTERFNNSFDGSRKVQTSQAIPSLPQREGKAGGSVVINNNAIAAPVTSGGGGGAAQQNVTFVPVRNQNDTVRNLQLANIPRG